MAEGNINTTVLGIKTAHKEGIELFLVRAGGIWDEANMSHAIFPTMQSDSLLAAIDGLVTPEELRGIVVLSGPGSFTAVRSAAVVANTIAAARGIPVVQEVSGTDLSGAMKRGTERILRDETEFPLAPMYDREPNITQPKAN